VADPGLVGSGGAYAQALAGDVVTYSTLKGWIAADSKSADDATAVASLPATNTSFPNANNNFFVTSSQEKALGHFSGNGSTVDGAMAFGTATTAPFWVGIALHELTHAMGRVTLHYESNPVINDMFRYDALGHFQWTEGASTAAPSYLSIDGGKTKLADFGQTSDYSDYLNTGVQGANDPFNEFYTNSTLQTLTTVDIQNMDVLGFDRVGATNHAPVVSLPNGESIKATAIQSFALASLMTATDADAGDQIFLILVDNTTAPSSGHFLVNGIPQAAGQGIVVAPGQQVTFQAGTSGNDDLFAAAYDGKAFSNVVEWVVTVGNAAPVMTPVAPNVSATANQVFQTLNGLVVPSDADDNINSLLYIALDNTTAASSGHFVINGVTQTAGQVLVLTFAQLSSMTFQAGISGVDDLFFAAYDGKNFSIVKHMTVTVGGGPVQPAATDVQIPDQLTNFVSVLGVRPADPFEA